MQPLLVLFDIDGTLIDTAGAGRRAVERAFLDVHGVDGSAPRDVVRFAGMTDPAIFLALSSALGIDRARHQHRLVDLHESYLRRLAAEMARDDPRRRVLPGVPELLDDLVGRPHVHLGLLTGNLERGARIKLEPFGLNRFFARGGFGSDDSDREAIARIAGERVARAAGVALDAARVVVVGDTEHDVACARANGFRAVAVESGWAPRDVLVRSGPDQLLVDLSDLAISRRALGVEDRAPGR